jgi:hypothetical protein
VDGLRRAAVTDYLPRGLLSRALLRFLDGDSLASSTDLEEAREIAERGPMPLVQADIHLMRARLSCDRNELALARQLIESHGFHRRSEELTDAEAASRSWETGIGRSADALKGASR